MAASAVVYHPALFSNLAETMNLAKVLIDCSIKQESFQSRISSITLLGFTRKVTPEVLEVIQKSIHDVEKQFNMHH